MSDLAIIIPILNEAALLRRTATLLAYLNDAYELILVDGGSSDDSIHYAQSKGFSVICSERGRGAQLDAGVQASHSPKLAFLHLDCDLEPPHFIAIYQTLERSIWGRFNVRFEQQHLGLSLLAAGINLRSRLSSIATGDQLIFCQRNAYLSAASAGMKAHPLMEDIYLSQCLRRIAKPVCLRKTVTISARYWQQHGLVRGVLSMWLYRCLFFFGVSPKQLYTLYYNGSKADK